MRSLLAVHRFLVRVLLPSRFRSEYGGELEAAFRERISSREGGRVAVVVAGEFLDLLRTAAREGYSDVAGRTGSATRALLMDGATGIRSLARAPAFSAMVIGLLALAIGANTAVFTVVDAILVSPLPYPEAGRIVRVAVGARPESGTDEGPFSPRGYWHIATNNRVFTAFGAGGVVQRSLFGDGPPIQATVALLTNGAFEAIGLQPLRGRLPTSAEDAPGGTPVALLSHGLWVRRYGADPDVLGRSIQLGPVTYDVIGIMPPEFDYPTPETDVWAVRQLDPATENFRSHFLEPIGRLAPGVSLEAAEEDVERLIAGFGELGYGPEWFESVFTGAAVVRPLRDEIVRGARDPLAILFATVGILLLVASANVANLLLVRTEHRAHALAVRQALGAGRGRLASHALMETLLLTLAGGVVGTGAALIATRALVWASPVALPRLDEVNVGGTAVLFAALVSTGTALLTGVRPAVRARAIRSLDVLRNSGARRTDRNAPGTRDALIVGQVALTLFLLVASGLLVRSLSSLRSVDPGFDPEGVLTFRLTPSPRTYPNPEASAGFYDALLREIQDIPGVTAVGGSTVLPLTGSGGMRGVDIEGFPTPEGEASRFFLFRRATPGYFAAMGIPLVEGREFTPDDHQQRLGSLLISASVKRAFWPDESALGKEIVVAGAPARVVGVVGDVHDDGLDVEAEHFVYKPLLDAVGGGGLAMTLAVRADARPDELVGLLREVVNALDPELPLSRVRTMHEIVDASVSRVALTMRLLVVAAAFSLLLASVGIYGVLSYVASMRRREMGLRMALGAEARVVRRIILVRGLTLTVLGIAFGTAGTLLATPALSSVLFDVEPRDLPTLGTVIILFLLVAFAAGLVPAIRIGATQPADALRAS